MLPATSLKYYIIHKYHNTTHLINVSYGPYDEKLWYSWNIWYRLEYYLVVRHYTEHHYDSTNHWALPIWIEPSLENHRYHIRDPSPNVISQSGCQSPRTLFSVILLLDFCCPHSHRLNELANLKPDERFYCQKSNYLHVFTLLPFRISYRTPTKDSQANFQFILIGSDAWSGVNVTKEKYILTIMRGRIPKWGWHAKRVGASSTQLINNNLNIIISNGCGDSYLTSS